ncbi:MAG: type II toxin-antitoxin system prevent-host-death family antitoxin [Desulfovibrionaceae bacterium]|nr:type II toxin-antitoxin system prevent-host-death family antitoxin [Desulfovibrionaceae bacterium]
METLDIHEAQTDLSGILARVERGESFIIAKAGRPVAQITPLKAEESRPKARTGFLKGHISVPDDFDSMASEAIVELFEGQA